MLHRIWIVVCAALVLVCTPKALQAATTWDGTTGYWTNASKWSGGLPVAGDDAVIPSGSVTIDESTPYLSSFTNSGTLTFSGWDVKLQATNVWLSGGTVRHAGCYATNQTPITSNRVYFVCSNLTIASGGLINVNTNGYQPFGPGSQMSQSRYGGGYGGIGGYGMGYSYGPSYGSYSEPVDPGSSGGDQSLPGYGGKGGGAVRIEATGRVTVEGTITANGGSGGQDEGGGSGGGIYITCDTFAGDGIIEAHGGISGGVSSGGGAGGRIAIVYNTTNQAGVSPKPIVGLSTAGSHGSPDDSGRHGKLGTLYFPDTQLLPELVTSNFNGVLWGFSSWSPNSLTMSNGLIQFGAGDFTLNATNDISFTIPTNYTYKPSITVTQLTCGGNLILNNQRFNLDSRPSTPSVNCGGNFTLTNSSTLYVYSGITNGVSPDYGALVHVGEHFFVGSNCWIYPYSDTNNGGSVLFRMKHLTISTNAGFDADSKGYTPFGPGVATTGNRKGGSYGGKGGGSYGGGSPGPTYGSSNAPVDPGSSGQTYNQHGYGGKGGGAVRIEATGRVTVNGTITANGGSLSGDNGGGSGGSVYITCGTFAGTGGVIQAKGADAGTTSDAGGGGGGRIAVWYRVPESDRARILAGDMTRVFITNDCSGLWDPRYFTFSGCCSVTNGLYGNPSGEPGTIIFLTVIPPRRTVIKFR